MQEKLLIKCDNTIYADEILELLLAHHIPARLHDESMDTVVGAYGAVTGIAVFVSAKDYDQAWNLVKPIVEKRNTSHPMCPKCGSEEVVPIVRKYPLSSIFALLSLVCILFPVIYVALPTTLALRSAVVDLLVLPLLAVGFVFLFVANHYNVNHRCNACGYKFNHFKSDL